VRRVSTDYRSFDSGGWMNKCDDLFLARYRGKPCEICGKTSGYENSQKVSSCGHHLIFKGVCRQFRYEPMNIVVLCPMHHSHYNPTCSPHSIMNTQAQKAFADWVRLNKPDQYKWWVDHQKQANKPFDKSWTYREMYERLGGEIQTKTGLIKDMKPKNHAASLRKIIEEYK
jgi:uncharacterized CHY-type Zn-finger protein